MKLRISLFLLALLVSLLVSFSFPGIALGLNTTLNTYEYLNTGHDNELEIYGPNMTGQTFTTGSSVPHTISQIRFLGYREGLPGILYFYIYNTSAGVPTGLPIGQGDISADAFTTDTAGIWYGVELDYEITFQVGATYSVITQAPAGTATASFHWRVDTSNGYAGGTEVVSGNSGISWTSVAANDVMFEILGHSGLAVVSVKVFGDFSDTGDQLFVLSYLALPSTAYLSDNPQDYLSIQLLEGSVIRAQTKLPSWGYKPGSLYLSLPYAVSWGSNTTSIRIVGIPGKAFAGYSSVYTLAAEDWVGLDLYQLDDWVMAAASDIEDYYGVTLITYVGSLPVLNDQGTTIFSIGIPGLSAQRPDLFSSSSSSVAPTPTTHGGSYVAEITGFFGGGMQATWEDLAELLGVDAAFVGTGFWVVLGGAVIGVVGAAVGHPWIGMVIAVPFFLVGAFGGIDIRYVILIAFLVGSFVLAKFTIFKSG